VLAIVGRELVLGEGALRAEWQRLARVLRMPETSPPDGGAALAAAVGALNGRLAEAIRAGDADAGPRRAEVLAHLRATSAERLAIANPKYAAPREP
jgi:hypothetical protein